jgi:hypothetical protein
MTRVTHKPMAKQFRVLRNGLIEFGCGKENLRRNRKVPVVITYPYKTQ